MGYPFALVLHTHLPMVVNHGRWPHGSDWLNEAAFECYLPLLDVAHRLVADGISPKWTINISPVLAEQLASAEFQKALAFYYDNVMPAGENRGDRRLRPGIEEMLAEYNLEYFIADAHLVAAAAPVFLYRDYVPRKTQLDAAMPEASRNAPLSPYQPYRVASRGGTGSAVAFFRDPKTTLQVWSREQGYPGDYAYLEFHKKHFPGGLRFWRITDSSGDLGKKVVYDPAVAAEKVRAHAAHFVELVTETLAQASAQHPAVVCSPYDAELFGHWWFEGPQWLEHVSREMVRAGVPRTTLGETLERVPAARTIALPEGSWGEGGDHRVWLNRETEWTWDRVYSAESEWAEHLARAPDAAGDLRRVLAQATREILLLEASDWQFLIT